MIFSSIVLENFGIFYGRQPLEFEPGLYVIHGRNGRGKTTLLNAVKWAFFGHFATRQGQRADLEKTLNRDAAREGTHTFSVELQITDGSDEYLVRRRCTLKPVFEESLYVERNQTPQTQAQARHALGNLLNEGISRFFLFDGEQLIEYERLLFEEGSADVFVKRSIEQILGLPVLENAIVDLAAVDAELGREVQRVARKNQKTVQFALQADQIAKEIEDTRDDLNELEKGRAEALERVADADAVLQRYETSLETLKKVESLEQRLEDIEQTKTIVAKTRADALAGSWRDVLSGAVAPRVAELDALQTEHEDRAQAARDAERAQKSLQQGVCDLCGESLTERGAERLGEIAQPDGADGNGVGPETAQVRLLFAKIVDTGQLSQASERDAALAELVTEEINIRGELKLISDAVDEAAEAQARTAFKDRDLAQQALGTIAPSIVEQEERLEKLEATHADLLKKIEAAGDSDELADLESSRNMVERLRGVFGGAMADYRDALRSQVETDASEIFRRLTTEPSHQGLRINDSYGLQTVGPDNEVVFGRSAGQEQIVALSLVGGLNRNATRRAPVMMDTPFGRLDPDHRAKVLAFLADMADQVFLLVHAGEVSDEDLAVIAEDITQHYELRRVSADRTEIRPSD
jgi:DNA sulfur modification protein DndD